MLYGFPPGPFGSLLMYLGYALVFNCFLCQGARVRLYTAYSPALACALPATHERWRRPAVMVRALSSGC